MLTLKKIFKRQRKKEIIENAKKEAQEKAAKEEIVACRYWFDIVNSI